MTRTLLATISALALTIAGAQVPALAGPVQVPDHVDLGRDGNGEACSADRTWADPGVTDPFAVSLAITCRGTTAGRHLGLARRVREADAEAFRKLIDCGDPRSFDLPGLGPVQARRCHDKVLGLPTIETSLSRDGRVLSVSAAVIDQGPAEDALRILAGMKITGGKPGVDLASLAAAPEQPATAADASASASDALYQGLRYIRAGLYGEASRVLNEALTREGVGLDNRLELLLLAGLTDSNLGYFDSAQNRFDQAEALLRANPDIAGGAVIDRKRLSYVALDELNRQDLTGALASLDKLTVVSDNTHPLLDPAVLVEINQSRRASRRALDSLASAPDANKQNAYSQLVIDAQANWARSFVLLAQGRHDDALTALATSDHDIGVLLDEGVSPAQILWLQARIERQRARLLLVKNDTPGALAAIDRAVSELRRAQVNGEVGPVLAEVEFDRAAILARDPGRRADAMAQFAAAVDELVSSDVQGLTPPPAVADYLNLLIDDAKSNPAGDSAERYFRAMQVVADPAIARQFVELQSLVSASPALAAKKQDEQDLEREVTRLRFEAADIQATDPAKAKALTEQHDAAQAKLLELQGELQQDQAYGAVSDSAATVADVQKALLPGEAYFKLTKVRDSLYAILIDGNGPAIWRVGAAAGVVDDVATKLHASIVGTDTKLVGYDVGRASALFQVLTGKQADRLLSAKALVVDSGGPLQRIPVGVLVASKASVAAYQASAKANPFDYSQVDFLVRHMPVSVALSPRSLIVARRLAPSAAPLPFIGFAQHQPAPETLEGAGQLVSVGSNCQVNREAIGKLSRALKPISDTELDRAAQALGLAKVPELTGAAFTDTAVMARTDLNQFQVLHFATHGLTEGPYFDYFRTKTDQWSCTTAPPALVTSLGTGQSTGILSFDKIARLKLDANLVVLSACDTASGVSIGQARAAGQEEAGASLEGLVRAFLAANARAVLSTYWEIPNTVDSQDLMAHFYRGARGGTIGEALREAQVATLSNPGSSHPFYWGAFFVVGDSNKPLLSGQARTQVAMNAAAPRP